jgi:hypothetical protein
MLGYERIYGIPKSKCCVSRTGRAFTFSFPLLSSPRLEEYTRFVETEVQRRYEEQQRATYYANPPHFKGQHPPPEASQQHQHISDDSGGRPHEISESESAEQQKARDSILSDFIGQTPGALPITLPRRPAPDPMSVFEKSNVLLVGPTGMCLSSTAWTDIQSSLTPFVRRHGQDAARSYVGKVPGRSVCQRRGDSFYASRMCVAPNSNLVFVEKFSFDRRADVGEDVESCVQRLAQAADFNTKRAS